MPVCMRSIAVGKYKTARERERERERERDADEKTYLEAEKVEIKNRDR